MSEASLILETYSKNPVNQYVMTDPTILFEQGNTVCGDSCIVFLRIEGEEITEFSHAGHPAMHTLAAASLLAEHIVGEKISTVLNRGYQYMKDLGFELSTRRQRSAVTALLATRNAIHQYLGDGRVDDYDLVLAS